MEKFIYGLRPEIQFIVEEKDPETLQKCIAAAIRAELNFQRRAELRNAPISNFSTQRHTFQQSRREEPKEAAVKIVKTVEKTAEVKNPLKMDRSRVTCFKCGRTGHFASNCRSAEKKEKKEDVRFCTEKGDDWDTIYEANHPDEFCALGSRLITLEGKVRNQPCLILLDCGASTNYISENLVQKCQLSPESLENPIQVKTADERVHQVTQRVTVDIHIDKKLWMTVSGLVYPMKYDLVFGLNWFQQTNPIIDWKNLTCQIGSGSKAVILQGNSERKLLKQQNISKTPERLKNPEWRQKSNQKNAEKSKSGVAEIAFSGEEMRNLEVCSEPLQNLQELSKQQMRKNIHRGENELFLAIK